MYTWLWYLCYVNIIYAVAYSIITLALTSGSMYTVLIFFPLRIWNVAKWDCFLFIFVSRTASVPHPVRSLWHDAYYTRLHAEHAPRARRERVYCATTTARIWRIFGPASQKKYDIYIYAYLLFTLHVESKREYCSNGTHNIIIIHIIYIYI